MKNILFGSCLSVFTAGMSQAAILAQYEANGPNGNFNTTAFDSVDTELLTTATALSQGGSLTGGGAANFVLTNALFDTSSSGSPGYNLADVNTANQAAAAAAGDFFTFDIQSGGNTVTFEDISFFSDQFGTTGQVDISYTISGGSEVFVLQNFTPVGGNADVTATTTDFADFTTTEDVTWTFYLYGAEQAAHGTRFDDIIVNGTVVPEPSTSAFVGLAGIALILRRRR